MTALVTASRDALIRELERHIGAHASIVANDLLASGAVRAVDGLPDDEALVDATVTRRLGPLHARNNWRDDPALRVEARSWLRALAAALTEDPS